MSQVIKVKSGNPFEEKGSYSRVVAADQWIFVSNTAGRAPKTKALSDNVLEQTEQVFLNIERALASVDARLADVVMSRVFIQNPQDTHTVMDFVGEKFRGIDPATTVTCPPLGSSAYLVEIEVTAYRDAGKNSASPVMMSV